jgi:hypothetical protein
MVLGTIWKSTGQGASGIHAIADGMGQGHEDIGDEGARRLALQHAMEELARLLDLASEPEGQRFRRPMPPLRQLRKLAKGDCVCHRVASPLLHFVA